MPQFGKTSLQKLNTCDTKIQDICNEAIKYIDFSIITGHRTKEEQDSLYPKFTKVKWPNGKHNDLPSKAVDVAPYIKPYGVIFGSKEQVENIMIISNRSELEVKAFIKKSYSRLIGFLEAIAALKDIDIRVGIDWDGDFDMLDQSFNDLGHLELK